MKYTWAVIGAGPAGIAAVGKLLDDDIPATDILWIDPAFAVGDFGSLWRHIPSNTKVELFLKFLNASDAFCYSSCTEDFAINHAPQHETCELRLMAEPLQWITEQLKNKIPTIQDTVLHLTFNNHAWNIQLKNSILSSKNIILAIGAEPKNLDFSGHPIIPLADAMDPQRIQKYDVAADTIAVFGSSHSAILVLRNLVQHQVKKVINFYRSPLRYAVYLKDWILFDDTGLKGSTADWARDFLEGELPANFERIYADDRNIQTYLPQCNKVVYAVGFEKRTLPVEDLGSLHYIKQTGMIAPGLFGLGIAFPEAKQNQLGIVEYRVGLWKFMDYLQRIMPIWLSSQII